MGGTSKLLIAGFALASSLLFCIDSFAAPIAQLGPEGSQTLDLTEVGEPVSGEMLHSLSGGQGISIDALEILANNMHLNADMTDNQLNSTTTGLNQVSNDAFANASGISTIVQNSGNQVIINNAFILNLQMK